VTPRTHRATVPELGGAPQGHSAGAGWGFVIGLQPHPNNVTQRKPLIFNELVFIEAEGGGAAVAYMTLLISTC